MNFELSVSNTTSTQKPKRHGDCKVAISKKIYQLRYIR